LEHLRHILLTEGKCGFASPKCEALLQSALQ
jgi:hypothetical protein